MKEKSLLISQMLMGVLVCFGILFFSSIPVYGEEKQNESQEEGVCRVRPVLEGETLADIAESVYGDLAYQDEIYELNKESIGNNPQNIAKGMYLVLPQPEQGNDYLDWDECYRMVKMDAEEIDIEARIAEDTGCHITDYFFYYAAPYEGKGEHFRICYPQLTFDDGRDAALINEAIRDAAMMRVSTLLVNRSEQLDENCRTDSDYGYDWIRSQVNYKITYLDENLISVVFDEYFFLGSIFLEFAETRAITVDLKNGHVYTNEELFEDKEALAEYIRKELILQKTDNGREAFAEIFTKERLVEMLNTTDYVEGRYRMSPYIYHGGVGFVVSYWISTDAMLMRGSVGIEMTLREADKYRAQLPYWDWLRVGNSKKWKTLRGMGKREASEEQENDKKNGKHFAADSRNG